MMRAGIALGMAFAAISIAHANQPAPAFSQPVEERKAQEQLPMASGEVWKTLLHSKISYSAKPPHITATKPAEIKAMNGRTLTVDGFMLPMDESEYSKHFLLSKRTPTCPFCPPGEPNEVIEVFATKGIYYDDSLLTMQGTFSLTNNTENGIFFVLKNAAVMAKAKPHYTVPMLKIPK